MLDYVWIMLAIVGAVFLFLALYTILGLRQIMTPTTGRQIERASRPNRAMLIIDVQSDFTGKTGRHAIDPDASEKAIANINHLTEKAQAKGMKLATIRQVQRKPLAKALAKILAGPEGLEGSPGLGLDPRITCETDADFEKDRGDAFSSLPLKNWLSQNRIGDLYLVGLDSCYCVNFTAQGALNRGYHVTILEPGVMTGFPEKWSSVKEQLTAAGAEISETIGQPHLSHVADQTPAT